VGTPNICSNHSQRSVARVAIIPTTRASIAAVCANKAEFADVGSYLPPTRSLECSYEYQTLVRAFRKEISPHIDQEMAKRVLDTDWLGSLESKPVPQK
jgi:hypothetical protein